MAGLVLAAASILFWLRADSPRTASATVRVLALKDKGFGQPLNLRGVQGARAPFTLWRDEVVTGGEKPVLQSTPQIHREPQVIERRVPANEDVESAHAGLFRAYNVEAALSASQGRPLAGIFRRMVSR
ncbi:hypothetical protein BH10PSE3_BH10PSE3_00420 [soil metagenome]